MNGETLGSFLRTRRDKTNPDLIGLDPAGAPRRVPGLRREELARFAGVSVGVIPQVAPFGNFNEHLPQHSQIFK